MSSKDLDLARALASTLDQRLGLTEDRQTWKAWQWRGTAPNGVPTLYLDDVSDIPFLVDISGVELYQHRARVRSGDGDIFVATTAPTEGYEPYCREHLRLGAPEFVEAEPVVGPLAVARACAEGATFEYLARRASECGGLVIHPYMGIESVWSLAKKLAEASGARVEVIAPTPGATVVANDKAHISEIVASMVGESYLARTKVSADPAELAKFLSELARGSRRVGLKRTRCASAMGNRVFDAQMVRSAAPDEVEALVRKFLVEKEWTEGEDVLAVIWEDTDCSPSSQLWLPPIGMGPPVIEGFYEQLLEGESRVFLGSRPSTLPAPVEKELGKVSVAVATVLQELGYVGRCSFDFLVAGDLHGEFRVMLTECNGRWGGTSTPMRLVDRFFPEGRPTYRAQDFVREALVGAELSEILAAMRPELFDPMTRSGRYVVYNVGPLRGSGKLDVIALGRSTDEVDEALEVGLPKLLGLSG